MVRRIEAPNPDQPAQNGDAQQLPPEVAGIMQMADAADSAALDATDLGVSEQQDGPLPAAAPTNAIVLAGAFKMVRDVFCGFTSLQTPATVITDAKAEALGNVWGAVADKHGLNLFALTGDYGLEIAAVVTTIPIALALHAGVKAELAARAAPPAQPEEGATLRTPPMPEAAPPATFTPGKIEPTFDAG